MNDDFQNDFARTNQNALSVGWFVSPLEYYWPDGKQLFDNIFHATSNQSPQFEGLCPIIYKRSMQIDFRSKMIVLAFMRQDISKSYGLEIENGLIHLYRLDYISCISQWIYVIEGYCRELFSVRSLKNLNPDSWTIPLLQSERDNSLILLLTTCLSKYLKDVLFKSTPDCSIEELRRHLLLHGNVKNKSVFNQKNCLILMFLIDALVVIEMVKNKQFPLVFREHGSELDKINLRKYLYGKLMRNVFHDDTLLQRNILKAHF